MAHPKIMHPKKTLPLVHLKSRKSFLALAICCLSITLLTISVKAEETGESKEGPCKKMMDACKAAHFAKGDHKIKRGLFKHCMQPLMAGESVPDVKIDAETIAGCKKIKEARKGK